MNWISADKLPDIEEGSSICSVECLLHTEDGIIGEGYLYIGDNNSHGAGYMYKIKGHITATHWMPLPPAP